MARRFHGRFEAGRPLATKLVAYAHRSDVLLLAREQPEIRHHTRLYRGDRPFPEPRVVWAYSYAGG